MNVGFGVWQVGARHSMSGNQGPYTTPPEEKASNFREYFDGVVDHPMLLLSQIPMGPRVGILMHRSALGRGNQKWW